MKPGPLDTPGGILLASATDTWLDTLMLALAPLPGGKPTTVRKASSLLSAVEERKPALVILDAVLEDCTGLACLRRIREVEQGREMLVMIIQHPASEMDRILAFENGADDFVAEPFSARELQSRIRALLRRQPTVKDARPRSLLVFGELEIDLRATAVLTRGHRVPLTAREFEVLRILVEADGRVVDRREILDGLRTNRGATSARVIDTHVKSIRRKLGRDHQCIETMRGVGYWFSPPRGDRSPSGHRSDVT